MLGVLGGYWLFSAFLDAGNPASPGWLDVYWWIAGACALTIVLLASAPFDESRAHEAGPPRALAEDFTAMVKLAARPLTIVFIISVFLYVLIEQGIGTWLPTFNRQLLGLSAPMSVQAASIFALSLAAGRLAAGTIVRRTGWFRLLVGCLAAMAVLILVVLPLAESAPQRAVDEWAHAPIAAFLFPLIGLFMAPIYPAINSAVLSAMPRPTHAAMVGLLVVFSALGGTTGSFIIGRVFAAIEGAGAFYLLLIPVAGVFLALRQLKTLTEHPSASGAALAS
jgi:fucose permease